MTMKDATIVVLDDATMNLGSEYEMEHTSATSSTPDDSNSDTEKGDDSGDIKNQNECKVGGVTCKAKAMAFRNRLWAVYQTYDFPIHILIVIVLAKAYPSLGAEYLQPKITAGWIALGIIFFVSGVSLKTGDLLKVLFKHPLFNIFVQSFNFLFLSAVIFGVQRFLKATNLLSNALADGLVICSCLPLSINAVIILTASANGDEAAAIFHATVGNTMGVFLSPLLIVLYLPGASANVDLPKVFLELTLKVIVPLIVGQLAQLFLQPLRDFYAKHKNFFKKIQEYCLAYIIYTVFCKTFSKNEQRADLLEIFLLILCILLLMTSFMGVAWFSLRLFFHDEPELRVMGLYGCTQKTLALGIPIILSIYEGNDNLGLYTLPILIWHPMNLVVGSTLIPRLKAFVETERKRMEPVSQNDEASVSLEAILE